MFDPEDFSLKRFSGEKINSELVFEGPYSNKSGLRRKLLKRLRGPSKSVLGIRDADFLWKGVQPRERNFSPKKFSEVEKDLEIELKDNKAHFVLENDVHKIEGSLTAFETPENKLKLLILFEIETKKHDLYCENVSIEFPGFEKKGNLLKRSNIKVSLKNSIVKKDKFDLSLSANWTHAGIYKGKLEVKN